MKSLYSCFLRVTGERFEVINWDYEDNRQLVGNREGLSEGYYVFVSSQPHSGDCHASPSLAFRELRCLLESIYGDAISSLEGEELTKIAKERNVVLRDLEAAMEQDSL
jgi:hypothetical protein